MEAIGTLIVGGGVAGASLAFHLSSAGVTPGSVRLVERAPRPGAHASGRNARLVLQSVAEPWLRRLTASSAAVYEGRAEEMGFHRCGSLLVGTPAALSSLREPALVSSSVLTAQQASARVPLLDGREIEAALFTPGDGVLDPQRLLAFYLEGARRAGAEVAFDVEVTSIAGSGPFRVATTAGPLLAERLVDAGGAWAGEIAACAGTHALPLVAYKRHLFTLDATLPEQMPYLWDLALDAYVRPDAEGMLACMCDEEPTAALAETVTPGVEELLREKLRPFVPSLAGAPLLRAWSCFRTKAPDGLPVIGPDPRCPAFWWLAGLGGFGIGASWELGRIAARGLLAGQEAIPAEMRPGRFAA